MWFRSEEQKDAQLIFNCKLALTPAVFHSDTSHALIKLPENWFQQWAGKPALGSNVMDRGHSISENCNRFTSIERIFAVQYN